MVIWEAEELRLGVLTFEDASMRDEVDEDQAEVYYAWSSPVGDGGSLPERQGDPV